MMFSDTIYECKELSNRVLTENNYKTNKRNLNVCQPNIRNYNDRCYGRFGNA